MHRHLWALGLHNRPQAAPTAAKPPQAGGVVKAQGLRPSQLSAAAEVPPHVHCRYISSSTGDVTQRHCQLWRYWWYWPAGRLQHTRDLAGCTPPGTTPMRCLISFSKHTQACNSSSASRPPPAAHPPYQPSSGSRPPPLPPAGTRAGRRPPWPRAAAPRSQTWARSWPHRMPGCKSPA